MRTIEKKCLSRTQKLTIILSSVLVFLIIASVVLSIVYANIPTQENESEVPEIDESIGESLYHGAPLAYPYVDTTNITAVVVRNEKGKFDLTRFPDENGEFYLGYTSPSGDETVINYLPPIMGEEANFDYESLYAMEQDDGYGTIFMLTYLCQAIGTPYFHERIALPADSEARAKMVRDYGLDAEHATSVSFTYGERDSAGKYTERGTVHITIGDAALNGQGRYYYVKYNDTDRDYIYYTQYNTLEYAEIGFEEFVKGVLVAEGLDEDKTFEPLLSTDFKEWKNEIIESYKDKDGNIIYKYVEDDHSVIAKGDIFVPIKESATYTPEKNENGYHEVKNSDLTFDITKLTGDDRKRVIDALVGKAIKDYSTSPIYITLLNDYYSSTDTRIDFGEAESVKYTYVIKSIEAILDYPEGDARVEIREDGVAVGTSDLIIVSYDYYIGGEKQNESIIRNAVIDLSDELLDPSAVSMLRAAAIGDLASAIELDVTYTKDTAAKTVRRLYVKDIVKIYDSNGLTATKVTANGYATITYYETVNGKASEVRSMDVVMSTVKEKAGFEGLYDALLDRGLGLDLALQASETVSYNEVMREFVTSAVTSIERCVKSELVVSFNFKNASERDPFYGESIYENTTDQYKLYGLHSDNCQIMLRLLGGIDEDSTHSTGLSGTTLAVGLTHDIMKEYDLYYYTIYFELPRGIYDVEIPSEVEGEESELDYASYDTLGFTLYISDIKYLEDPATGLIKKYRYVGSDMYDLVAVVENEKLEFVDYSFLDFWARKNVVLVDMDNVAEFGVDFYMTDVYGSYDFDIRKDKVYKKGQYMSLNPDDFDGEYDTSLDWYNVYVKQGEGSMQDTELAKYIAANGTNDKGYVGVHALYNAVMGGGEELTLPNSIEWVGVSNFMLAYQILQLTTYEGTLTDEERAAASEDNKLMRIRLSLKGKNASELPYVYEFYRVAGGKIMVKFYQLNSAGNPNGEPVTDFYISNFAFKKVVSAYLSLFNAEDIDVEVPYPDELG